jgi:hypothetical protein
MKFRRKLDDFGVGFIKIHNNITPYDAVKSDHSSTELNLSGKFSGH